MRRVLLMVGLLACASIEFLFYPGHSYLQGESQLLVPMLERLQFPGLLSRDLVATHPVLRYTAYDETTLALVRVGHSSLERALAWQLFGARLAALVGAFLLASACGAGRFTSLAVAGIAGLGSALPAISIFTSDSEPVPYAIALGWIVLATGLAVKGRIMGAGLTASVALLYSPAIAIPWWLSLLGAAAWRKLSRPLLRPLLTTFAIAGLLLANLAQLQPGAPGGNALFSTVSASWEALLNLRTPGALVKTWIGHEGWLFAAVVVTGLCAIFRRGESLKPTPRRLLTAIMIVALFSMPFGWMVEKFFPWALWLHFEPERSLAAATVVCLVLVMTASSVAWDKRYRYEALVWGIAALSLLATPLLLRRNNRGPVFSERTLQALSDWAQHSTWGGSMFLFTGVGTQTDAGKFRALSLRPVYVDWESGELSRYYPDAALEWRARWDRVHAQSPAIKAMTSLLGEPIDYYVMAKSGRLPSAVPVFATDELVVYDARDLREASKQLLEPKTTHLN